MGILFLLPCIRRELPVAGPVGGILRKTDVQDRLFYGQLNVGLPIAEMMLQIAETRCRR